MEKTSLANGFVWKRMPGIFATDAQIKTPFLGEEFLFAQIVHESLEALHAKTKVIFFPLETSPLIDAIIAKNIFGHCSHSFSKYFVTLPQHVINSAKLWVSTFPSPVVQQKEDKVFFYESTHPYRLLLNSIYEKESAKISFFPSDFGPVRDVPVLLPKGMLPYLQMKFNFLAKELEEQKESENVAYRLIEEVMGEEKDPICVIAPFAFLASLGNKLEEILASGHWKDLGTGFKEGRVSWIGSRPHKSHIDTKEYELLLIEDTVVADLSILMGPLARHLVSGKKPIYDWRDLVRTSFTEAFDAANERYLEWTKVTISDSKKKDFYRFLYRLTLVRNQMIPSAFDMILSAQSIMDSNFAVELAQECRTYPGSKIAESVLRKSNITVEKLFGKSVAFSVKQFETLQKYKPKWRGVKLSKEHKLVQPVQPIDENKYADNSWVSNDHPYACSFPDEDIFMESYAFQLREDISSAVRAQQIKVTECTGSLGDGLDIRETLRQLPFGKIMVREETSTGKADVGSVIMIFAQEHEDLDKYSWLSFWLAEKHDNSNLMFFATPFQDELIGPGIAKSTFGGFAVIPIPSYSGNPWAEPFIQHYAKSPAEALLLAAALATEHRAVLFLADKPPRQEIVQLLRSTGKYVIYQRLDEIPAEKLKSLKTFHVLAESGVRSYAAKYIRKE